MYPSCVKFVYSADGLPDDEHHTVIVVNACSPLDKSIDRALILTLSTHYDTVTVVLKTEISADSVAMIASLKEQNEALLTENKRLNYFYGHKDSSWHSGEYKDGESLDDLKQKNAVLIQQNKILNYHLYKHDKPQKIVEPKKTYHYADDARPTCDDGDCSCEACVAQRAWDESYDANTGVLK
jgi:hypothetical protein